MAENHKVDQTDVEKVINALLKQVKTTPVKAAVEVPKWIDRRFGLPQSGEEFLWRAAWLICIPGIIAILAIPIAVFVWQLLPIAVIVTAITSLGLYWLVYQWTLNAAGKLASAVDIQFAIPFLVFCFVLLWEIIRNG